MKTADTTQHGTRVQNASRHRFFSITAGVSLTMAALFLSCDGVSLCSAASRNDGALLHRKHCASCHPNTLKTSSPEDLFGPVRTPPSGMPALGEDKLSDLDVQAIGIYLFSASHGEGPGPASHDPARANPGANPGTEQAPKASTSAKEKRKWLGSFGTPDD